MHLVLVVRLFVFKHDMQPCVIGLVIHGTRKFLTPRTDAEVRDSSMVCQVLLAGVYQFLNGDSAGFLESKKNHVGDTFFGHLRSPISRSVED